MGTRRPDVGAVGPAGTGPSPLGRASVVSPLPRAMSLVAAVLVVLLTSTLASAEEEPEVRKAPEETGEVEEAPATEDGNEVRKTSIRFRPVDIFLDSRDAKLAAYQVEVRYDKSRIKIVGVEGADAEEAEGFNPPPYFDRKGMDAGRIVIAAFVTDDLLAPAGRTRVATLHLRVEEELKDEREGEGALDMSVRLVTAARPGGERIAPEVELVGRKVEMPADAPKGAQMAAKRRAGADDAVLMKPDADPPERVDVASPRSKAEETAESGKEGSER